jgi:HEAT repeat protein
LSTSFILVGALLGIGLGWMTLVGCTLVNRILYDRQMQRLAAVLEEQGTAGLSGQQWGDHIGQVLRRSTRGVLCRLLVDPAQPETLRHQVAALLLSRYGQAALAREAAHGRWFSRRWRRIVAWHALCRTRSAELHPLLRDALNGRDRALAAAAAAMLGALQDRAAAAILVDGLQHSACAPACIAMQLERFDVAIKDEALSLLLNDPRPLMRFWAIRLLSRGSKIDMLDKRLSAHACDPDPSVRKAVAQAMGEIGGVHAHAVAVNLLNDEAGFVRAHAVRALTTMSHAYGEIALRCLLKPFVADPDWWVRLAVREALIAKRDTLIPFGATASRLQTPLQQPVPIGAIARHSAANVARAPR